MACKPIAGDARRRHAAALIAAGKAKAATAYRLMLCCTASRQGTICPWLVKGPGGAIVKCAGYSMDGLEVRDLYVMARQSETTCPKGVW